MVIEIFEELSKIPRCSFQADEFKRYLQEYAKKYNFEVKTDSVGNVLCKKGEPSLCLQSHYDMVCLGDAPDLKLLREGDILRAKNSTLGADNGMGVAIMLSCMQKYDNLETLFTADEEVGLIGATNLELEISSPNILNIDGEDESEIYIGCAGGSDVVCEKELDFLLLDSKQKVYKATLRGLEGGHSGVDIDKNIPSAIKILARFLVKNDCELIDIKAGERRNSIAKDGFALFTCRGLPRDEEHIEVQVVENQNFKKIQNSKQLIKMLDAFSQGVRAWNKDLNIPQDSANLGIVEIENGVFRVIVSLRSMSDEDMALLEAQTESFFDLAGFKITFPSTHSAWTPKVGEFSKRVKKVASKYIQNIDFKAIHAGLECGVLLQTQKSHKEAVSIGPNIRFPHSLREECDLDSVKRVEKIVDELIGS